MTSLIADTGPVAALLNPRDCHHQWAVACFRSFRPPLYTCEAVLSEAWHLLRRIPSSRAVLATMVREGVFDLSFHFASTQAETLSLLEKYRDTPIDFADACLVRMSELRSDCKVWTVDSDFKVCRRSGRRVIPVIAPWT